MALPHDYANVIARHLQGKNAADYEAFYRLATLYRHLTPDEQPAMAAGLALAIENLEGSVGAMADAIHLAYHLDLFTDDMDRAIAAVRVNRLIDTSGAIQREIANYEAYHPRHAPRAVHA